MHRLDEMQLVTNIQQCKSVVQWGRLQEPPSHRPLTQNLWVILGSKAAGVCRCCCLSLACQQVPAGITCVLLGGGSDHCSCSPGGLWGAGVHPPALPAHPLYHQAHAGERPYKPFCCHLLVLQVPFLYSFSLPKT